MKLNKNILFSIGVSLFSTMILTGINSQQVKADTTQQTQSTTKSSESDSQSDSGQTQATGSDSDTSDTSTASSSDQTQAASSDSDTSDTSTTSSSDQTQAASSDSDTSNTSTTSSSDQTQTAGSNSDTSDTSTASSSDQTQTASSDSTTTADDADTEEQEVNITFTDQNGNQVADSKGNIYTLTGNYTAGSTISSDDLASQISTALNGAYTLDSDQNLTVIDGTNKYAMTATANSYNTLISIYKGSSGYGSKQIITVGEPAIIKWQDNASTAKSISGLSQNGYGFSYLQYNYGTQIPNSSGDTFTLTYDMIPDLLNSTASNTTGFYNIEAVYNTPLDQTVTFRHVDTSGNEIAGTTDLEVTEFKTGDTITDLSSYASDIDGYTYTNSSKANPYTVADSNTIDLIYTENNQSYLKVNYVDSNSGETVYSDYVKGNSGDSVVVKDISEIDGYSKYELSDSSQAGNYTMTSDNETLDVDVKEKSPFTYVLNQTVNGITYSTDLSTAYGDAVNYSDLTYLGDLSNTDSVSYSIDGQSASFDKDTLTELLSQGNTLKGLIESVIPEGYTVNSNSSGISMTFNITYGSTSTNPNNINITYQTSDGTTIKTFSSLDVTTSSPADLVTSNLPEGYTLANSTYPYYISSTDSNSISLTALVSKDSSSDSDSNSGSDSDSNSGSDSGSNSNSGSDSSSNSGSSSDSDASIPKIISNRQTISVYSGTTVNIYDNNGNVTGKTVQPTSNWYSDEEMNLNGQIYYRIATDQWLLASDAYPYYSNSVDIRIYIGSNEPLVDSKGNSTNLELSSGSNWHSDRYAYFNNQKYYRVASNEWISAKYVFEYQSTKQVVHTTGSAQLFNDRGKFVRNISNSSLKTDKIAIINGIKMYRVATDEWLPEYDIE